MKNVGCVLLGVLLLVSQGVTARAEDKAPVAWAPMATVFGPCGSGMPPGALTVIGHVLHGAGDGLRRHDSRLNDSVDSSKINEVIKLRYGITPGLDIRTSTPVYNVDLDRRTGPGRDIYGVGDTNVILHKVLFRQGDGAPLSLGLEAGLIVPTATVGQHSSDPTGNACWGGMAGLGLTWLYAGHRVDTEVNYAMFTEGAKDYRKGNRFRWNLAYAFAMSAFWDMGAESLLEMSEQSAYRDQGSDDSYVEWYIGPKIVFKYSPWKLNVGLMATFPVQRWYEGNKVGSDDYRVECKFTKTFDIGTVF